MKKYMLGLVVAVGLMSTSCNDHFNCIKTPRPGQILRQCFNKQIDDNYFESTMAYCMSRKSICMSLTECKFLEPRNDMERVSLCFPTIEECKINLNQIDQKYEPSPCILSKSNEVIAH